MILLSSLLKTIWRIAKHKLNFNFEIFNDIGLNVSEFSDQMHLSLHFWNAFGSSYTMMISLLKSEQINKLIQIKCMHLKYFY